MNYWKVGGAMRVGGTTGARGATVGGRSHGVRGATRVGGATGARGSTGGRGSHRRWEEPQKIGPDWRKWVCGCGMFF